MLLVGSCPSLHLKSLLATWEDPEGPQRTYGMEVNWGNRAVALDMIRNCPLEPKWNVETQTYNIKLPQQVHPEYR